MTTGICTCLAICYKACPGANMVESLRRDFNFGNNDNFIVFIDPFEDQTTGFSFGVNANGAQWDGTMYGGGSVDLNWDNKWVSAVTNDDRQMDYLKPPFLLKHCATKKTTCTGASTLAATI